MKTGELDSVRLERERGGREGENKAVKQLDTHTYSAFTLGFNKLNAFQTLQPARFQPVSPPRSARFPPFPATRRINKVESELLPNLHETFLPEEADDAAAADVCLKEVGSTTCFFASFNQVRPRLFHVSLSTVALFFFLFFRSCFWSELRYDRPSSERPGPHTDHVCPPYCAMKMEGEEREQSGWVAHIRDVFSRLKT